MELQIDNNIISLKKDSDLYENIVKLSYLKEKYISIMAKGNIIYKNCQFSFVCDTSNKKCDELWEEYLKDISWIKVKERTSFDLYSKLRDYINSRISKDSYSHFNIVYDNELLNIGGNKSHYDFYFQSVELSNFINDYKDFLKSEIKKLLFVTED